MSDPIPCPMTLEEMTDAYFLDHRAKLIDIAAFLDRLDRAQSDQTDDDFRIKAFRECLQLLIDGRSDRARRILEKLSDHSTEPLDQAPMKGAMGAPPPSA
ncbi:MAG: hypothetical protein MK089_04525 [Phycisphaerales bacterium]|nr:hypothetical protein [Phycisphaerales bacterium]